MVKGQQLAVQDLTPVEVGYRHFSRRYQVVIRSFDMEHIGGKLGQLAGTQHAGAVHQEGREKFGIAVFDGVQVEHKVNQSPLQPCPGAAVKDKTRPGHLAAALKIDDPQVFRDLPVRPRFKLQAG